MTDTELDALAERAFNSPGIQSVVAEDAVKLLKERSQQLAEEFRRLAAHSDLCAKAADISTLTALHSGEAHAFEQAAQMLEEKLS